MTFLSWSFAWLWQPRPSLGIKDPSIKSKMNQLEASIFWYTCIEITLFCLGSGSTAIFLINKDDRLNAIISIIAWIGVGLAEFYKFGYRAIEEKKPSTSVNTKPKWELIAFIGLISGFIALALTHGQLAYGLKTLSAFSILLLHLWPDDKRFSRSADLQLSSKNTSIANTVPDDPPSPPISDNPVQERARLKEFHSVRRLLDFNSIPEKLYNHFFSDTSRMLYTYQESALNHHTSTKNRQNLPPLVISERILRILDAKEDSVLAFCPMTGMFMADPVKLTTCDIIVDRVSIIAWIASGHKTCPYTQKPINLDSLKTDMKTYTINKEFAILCGRGMMKCRDKLSKTEELFLDKFNGFYSEYNQSNRQYTLNTRCS